jgi:hypothetical protein
MVPTDNGSTGPLLNIIALKGNFRNQDFVEYVRHEFKIFWKQLDRMRTESRVWRYFFSGQMLALLDTLKL